jgi:hypothetical protein
VTFTKASCFWQTPRVTALSPHHNPHTRQIFGLNGHISQENERQGYNLSKRCTCFVNIPPVFVTRTANNRTFDIVRIYASGPCYEQREVPSHLQLNGNCPEAYIFPKDVHVRVSIATGTHVCWFTHYRESHSPPTQEAGPRISHYHNFRPSSEEGTLQWLIRQKNWTARPGWTSVD